MKQDRFLLAIVVVIGVLIVLALGLFFFRRGSQDYLSENSPQAVVHNYVLALQKGDFERAYGYLYENTGKPSFTQFHQAFINNQLNTSMAAIQIDDSTITGDEATIDLTLLQSGGGVFADTFRQVQAATAARQKSVWKIEQMPFPYWSYDWYNQNGIPPSKAAPAVPVPAPTTTPTPAGG